MSHNYVSQTYFEIIKNNIDDNFLFSVSPLHAPVIYKPKIITNMLSYKISSIFHFCHSQKITYTMKNGCVNTLKINKGAQCT